MASYFFSLPRRPVSQGLRRIALAWFFALVAGSLQPFRPGPALLSHRTIHFLAFSGAAFFLLLLSRTSYQVIRALLAVSLLGLALETSQHLIYRGPMEWIDVRDDVLAVLSAFLFYRLCSFLFSRAA